LPPPPPLHKMCCFARLQMQTHARIHKGKVMFCGYVGGNCEIIVTCVALHCKAFGLIPRHRYIIFHCVLWDIRTIASTVKYRSVGKRVYRCEHNMSSDCSVGHVGPLSVYVGKRPKIRRPIFLTSAIQILLSVCNVAPWNFLTVERLV
jgi:hypothetical protein